MKLAEDSGRRGHDRAEKSLLARALGHLARREHTRLQLQRRLAPFAESAQELEQLLERLQKEKLLSNARFADVIARRRAERFGAARIAQELKQNGVEPDLLSSVLAPLKETELARAQALWQRKFGQAPAGAPERARQMRFMRQRGFTADIVRRVIRESEDS